MLDSLNGFGSLIAIGVVLFLIIAIVTVYISKYKTAGPDEALIVTGSYLGKKNVHTDDSGNRIKIIRGGGTFVFPVFQQAQPLSLLSSKSEDNNMAGGLGGQSLPTQPTWQKTDIRTINIDQTLNKVS